MEYFDNLYPRVQISKSGHQKCFKKGLIESTIVPENLLTIEHLLKYFIVRDRRPLHFKLELANLNWRTKISATIQIAVLLPPMSAACSSVRRIFVTHTV